MIDLLPDSGTKHHVGAAVEGDDGRMSLCGYRIMNAPKVLRYFTAAFERPATKPVVTRRM